MTKGTTVKKSAIVLAGGISSRFGLDKGILRLDRKPLIKYVVSAIGPIVDETIVVTNSSERAKRYAKYIPAEVKFAFDSSKTRSPLIGAYSGFRSAKGEYSLLLPFDTPFVSREVILLLFDLCQNKTAVIPRWPNCHIEPLLSIYKTKPALIASKTAMDEGKFNMRAMIEKLQGVRYVSTMVIQQLDPELNTFLNINTPSDLKQAASVIKSKHQLLQQRK
jgi:molybdopterin-guanine dinucleotide biosynthesis protein A